MMRAAFALAFALALAPAAASAYPTLRSFTPTSLLVPILGIELRAADGQVQPIHVCSGATPDDCLVDLADEDALVALFTGSTTVDEGVYTGLSVVTCGADGGFDVKVQGSAEIGGTVWYTSDDGSVVSSNPAVAGLVDVPVSGCRLEVPFPEPQRVEPGAEVDLSTTVVLDALGVIGLPGADVPPTGCAVSPVRHLRVCLGHPHMIPSFGAPPTLRRYYVTEDLEDTKAFGAQGVLVLALDKEGEPFGGLTRALYLPSTVEGHVDYETPLKRITPNGDGSYRMLNYGHSSDPEDMSSFGVLFPAFSLATHSKVMLNELGEPVDYLAVEMP